MIETVFAIIGVIASIVTALTGAVLVLKWAARKFGKVSATNQTSHRIRLREEFASRLGSKDAFGTRGRVTIRDVDRSDIYPDADGQRGSPSSWFAGEIKDLYHRGVEVFADMPVHMAYSENRGEWRISTDPSEDRILAYPVARIPYDSIVEIDWEGDEYFPNPHIFCKFNMPGKRPSEGVPLYARTTESDYLFEIEGFRPFDIKRRRLFDLTRFFKRGK